MSIFDNIGRRVSETAKTAAKKSGDIVETTKLNINIAAEEDKIKRVYDEIGKAVYHLYNKGCEMEDSVRAYCEEINSIEKHIEEMKHKILELRDVKECSGCGTELHVEMAYCHKCGTKQPMYEIKEEKSRADNNNSDIKESKKNEGYDLKNKDGDKKQGKSLNKEEGYEGEENEEE